MVFGKRVLFLFAVPCVGSPCRAGGCDLPYRRGSSSRRRRSLPYRRRPSKVRCRSLPYRRGFSFRRRCCFLHRRRGHRIAAVFLTDAPLQFSSLPTLSQLSSLPTRRYSSLLTDTVTAAVPHLTNRVVAVSRVTDAAAARFLTDTGVGKEDRPPAPPRSRAVARVPRVAHDPRDVAVGPRVDAGEVGQAAALAPRHDPCNRLRTHAPYKTLSLHK